MQEVGTFILIPLWLTVHASSMGNATATGNYSTTTGQEETLVDISYLFTSTERSVQKRSTNELQPSRTREARSSSYEFGHLLPVLMQAVSALQKQADAPQQQPPAPVDAATTPSPLEALLPFLISALGSGTATGIGGAKSSMSISLPSVESLESGDRSRAQGVLSGAIPPAAAAIPPPPGNLIAAEPPPSNLVAKPSQSADLHLPEGTNKGAIAMEWKHNFDAEVNCTVPRKRSSVCNDLPVSKILSLKNSMVVTKDRNVYRVKPNGDPIDMEPTLLDKRIDDITATVTIEGKHFVFQGDKYAKYEKDFRPSAGNYPRLVTDGFPGVITPVDGAFQLNNHTWVFVSGTKYVYFQPAANPNVDPRYSPQYLDSVPGAPPTVDSAFTIKNRRFLYKNGIIYEISPDVMKVEKEIPVFISARHGWLKCPDLFPPECSGRNAEKTATEIP